MSIVERPEGKDEIGVHGLEIDGTFYSNLKLIKALAKALIKNGVVTLAEIKGEL